MPLKQDSQAGNTSRTVRFNISPKLSYKDYIPLKTVKGNKRVLTIDAINKYPTSLYRTISDKSNPYRVNKEVYKRLMMALQIKNPVLYDEIQVAKKKRQFRERVIRNDRGEHNPTPNTPTIEVGYHIG
ncbi:MAG: hypothetical protein RIB64_17550 [Arenibacter algicola]